MADRVPLVIGSEVPIEQLQSGDRLVAPDGTPYDTGSVGGNGTTNTIPKWASTTDITDSGITDSGTTIRVGDVTGGETDVVIGDNGSGSTSSSVKIGECHGGASVTIVEIGTLTSGSGAVVSIGKNSAGGTVMTVDVGEAGNSTSTAINIGCGIGNSTIDIGLTGSTKTINIGTSTALIGFYGGAATGQQAANVAITDLTGGLASTTFNPCGNTLLSDQSAVINDNFANVAAQLNAIRAALRASTLFS